MGWGEGKGQSFLQVSILNIYNSKFSRLCRQYGGLTGFQMYWVYSNLNEPFILESYVAGEIEPMCLIHLHIGCNNILKLHSGKDL